VINKAWLRKTETRRQEITFYYAYAYYNTFSGGGEKIIVIALLRGLNDGFWNIGGRLVEVVKTVS
jgi:hypothetical protein